MWSVKTHCGLSVEQLSKHQDRHHAMQSKTNVNNQIGTKTSRVIQVDTISVLFITKEMHERRHEANNISSKLIFFSLILKILRRRQVAYIFPETSQNGVFYAEISENSWPF